MSANEATPLRLNFANRIEAVPVVRRRVERFLLSRGCQRKAAGEFVLAVDELCNNAVQYGPEGSRERLSLRVHVEGQITRCQLTARNDTPVEELQRMTEAAELPDFESERGRGLYLIRMMVDALVIVDKGEGLVEMVMEKRL